MNLRAAYRAGLIAAALFAALPAHAQYYEYGSDKPQVEMNLEVVDGPDAPKLRAPAVPAEKVEQQEMPPPPIVQEGSRAKLLLKPVFTEPGPEEETAPPPTPPRHVQSAPVRTTAPVATRKPSPPPAPVEREEKHAASPAVPLPSDLTLGFVDNTSDLAPDLQQKLDGVMRQMNDLPDTRLQVRAYATGEDGNTSSARRISLSRALSVRSYLMDKGIKPNRVDVRALGAETDHGPLDRVDLVFVQ